jgi:hypothetical protein
MLDIDNIFYKDKICLLLIEGMQGDKSVQLFNQTKFFSKSCKEYNSNNRVMVFNTCFNNMSVQKMLLQDVLV